MNDTGPDLIAAFRSDRPVQRQYVCRALATAYEDRAIRRKPADVVACDRTLEFTAGWHRATHAVEPTSTRQGPQWIGMFRGALHHWQRQGSFFGCNRCTYRFRGVPVKTIVHVMGRRERGVDIDQAPRTDAGGQHVMPAAVPDAVAGHRAAELAKSPFRGQLFEGFITSKS